MIKTLSPYYVTNSFVSPNSGETCSSYTLNMYVWDGDSTTPPLSPSFSHTKQNVTLSTGNSRINVARILNSFIDLSVQKGTGVELVDGNNAYWVKFTTNYTTTDPTDDGLDQNVSTELITRGYAYGDEGENTDTPSNKIMQFGTEFNVSRTSFITLSIEM